jgi:hypothetical protein
MKYLKCFESHDPKMDLIRDVFEDMDLEYDVDIKVSSAPDFYYTRSGESEIKSNRTIKYYVYLKINGLIDDKFGKYLKSLIDKCESWANLKMTMWSTESHPSRHSADKEYLPHHMHSLYVINQSSDWSSKVRVDKTIEIRFMDIKINESIDEFDNELIRDYFNDFELDNDITLHIDHDEDEFGKFYSISFGLHKLTREMVDELRNSMVRVCSKENLEFESAVIGGWQTENIDEFNNHLYEWTILNTHPPYIELVLKPRD